MTLAPLRSLAVAAVFVSVAPLIACSGTQMTAMPMRAPAHADDCAIDVVKALPAGDFVFLGTIDLMGGTGRITPSATEFRSAVRQDVCRAGGDLVVADPQGEQFFHRGAVYRKAETVAATSATSTP